MNDKQMLRVERKVIEDILADAREPGTDYMAARKVLRALLDLTADRTVLPFAIGRCANKHCGSQAREISPYCSKCEPDL